MLKKVLDVVIEKFSDINPIKNFFAYFFRRILNNYVDRDITMSDFKDGLLKLSNLPLAVKKINSMFLRSSPYILHKGLIGEIKITLPKWRDLANKSIEIEISGIDLTFKLNNTFLKKRMDFFKN